MAKNSRISSKGLGGYLEVSKVLIIKYITPKNNYYQFFLSIKFKFCVRKKTSQRNHFVYAPKHIYVIKIDHE